MLGHASSAPGAAPVSAAGARDTAPAALRALACRSNVQTLV